jgi:predicted  nucleic acid-binding Zn-ribbon protein
MKKQIETLKNIKKDIENQISEIKDWLSKNTSKHPQYKEKKDELTKLLDKSTKLQIQIEDFEHDPQ